MNTLSIKKNVTNNKRGFTIIELLVVVAVIALLSTIAIGTLSETRLKAKDAKIKTELHGITLVLEEYNTAHGGYPNPTGSQGNMYCIGATDCLLVGESVSTIFPESIAKTISNLASIFPTFTENATYTDADGYENRGYIYVSCGDNTPTCPPNTAIILYPTRSSIKALRVGTYSEVNCELESCSHSNNSGGDGNDCGPIDNEACSNFCPSNQALNYDQDGTGSCHGTWFSYSMSASYYGYTYASGWSGNGYYGDTYPSGHSYYNGSGDCIPVDAISNIVDGTSLSGNYCSNSNTPFSCKGQITTVCRTINSMSECNSNQVCNWVAESSPGCSGNAPQLTCDQFDSSNCNNVSGCTWITGSGNCSYDGHSSCGDLDSSSCNTVNGCSYDYSNDTCGGSINCDVWSCGYGCIYSNNSYCSGTPWNQPSCSSGTDQYSCISISSNCTWNPGNTANCEQKQNISCSSFGDESQCSQIPGCTWTNI